MSLANVDRELGSGVNYTIHQQPGQEQGVRATTEEVRDRVHIGAILAQAKMAGFSKPAHPYP